MLGITEVALASVQVKRRLIVIINKREERRRHYKKTVLRPRF